MENSKPALSPDRVEVLNRIKEYERLGKFNCNVENDLPGRVLMPDEVDYLRRGIVSKIKTKIAFSMARRFLNNMLKTKGMIVKEIKGIENFQGLKSGAIITCNHFNALDSFAVQMLYEAAKQPKRTFFRVINEANYTSFPGFFGRLMRDCNTLPLSSNIITMKNFINGVNTHLQNGHFILFYPEQAMWWNYRKPRPLQIGAFTFASKNKVPVLPCFITMNDSDIVAPDGSYVQEYTINVGQAIYPDTELSYKESAEIMLKENERVWKEIYEREYGIPLKYDTEN